ncbi:hypothetical protein, conserved [Trypanosoma brucei gambiense DAL972]|uniref:Uncharacterized protein n=1 Tax=Trypanosoma brucei gambiense (strain MHOM/CI/86/DAL972) TaxID=679716 RepID=D0AAB9_TRYB9|nr:LOW QUALITY PROTEIN: hypothetical protein, conserved [Trypanosoma brucei gambiense DAL972]CBH18620.1 hypothetical protein, conserved [Trypanosoma brucei gambiense DAL972]|eukprot:XP_011780884.1 LOW QUALITY PROTEIN: hypothetical protein, conserved [Trypanosoma brucei gambiense DAL972]
MHQLLFNLPGEGMIRDIRPHADLDRYMCGAYLIAVPFAGQHILFCTSNITSFLSFPCLNVVLSFALQANQRLATADTITWTFSHARVNSASITAVSQCVRPFRPLGLVQRAMRTVLWCTPTVDTALGTSHRNLPTPAHHSLTSHLMSTATRGTRVLEWNGTTGFDDAEHTVIGRGRVRMTTLCGSIRSNDDPVRQHQELSCRRTFSAAVTGANEGVPLWNYYAEVGQEYGLPSHFPLSFMAPFIHQYTSRAWSRKEIERHLKVVEERTGLRTIQQACDATSELLEWGEEEMGVVPHGLLQHVVMLAEDIVLQNKKKAYRKAAHERGILRTTTMERYYALPHLRTGPPMPTTLEQPSGEFPWGKFSTMVGGTRIHPLYRPDGFFKDNMYPA